jgi:hypothetical protein
VNGRNAPPTPPGFLAVAQAGAYAASSSRTRRDADVVVMGTRCGDRAALGPLQRRHQALTAARGRPKSSPESPSVGLSERPQRQPMVDQQTHQESCEVRPVSLARPIPALSRSPTDVNPRRAGPQPKTLPPSVRASRLFLTHSRDQRVMACRTVSGWSRGRPQSPSRRRLDVENSA